MFRFWDRKVSNGGRDTADLCFRALATKLPRGGYSPVALCLKGKYLSVYDIDDEGNPVFFLYQINLKRLNDIGVFPSSSALVLEFIYQGDSYSFSFFGKQKIAIKMILEKARKF